MNPGMDRRRICFVLACLALGATATLAVVAVGVGSAAHLASVLAARLGVVLVSLSVHEWAHGRAALALGDTTARDEGRLTLNPLAHFDVVGLVFVPLALLLAGAPVLFGWARPVPVDFSRLRHPRLGMAAVAAAGPAANLVIVGVGAIALRLAGIDGTESILASAAWLIVVTNLALAVVNLMPFYPMDGGRVVSAIMPRAVFDWLAENEGKMFAATFAILVFLPWGLELVDVDFSPIKIVGGLLDVAIGTLTGSPDGRWADPLRAWALGA